jgi:glucokinase
MSVIAIDLGGTKLAGAIFSSRGTISHRTIVALEGRGGRAVGRLIRAMVTSLMDTAMDRGIEITGVGICVPGIAWQKTGRVWAPNIPGWKNYQLKKEISAALKGQSIPVHIDSDRACYILGETWRGAARGCKDAIFLAVGTGIGAGILVDGKILRGTHDIAGAIGWMALDRPFEKKYTPCGCFEYHASGDGLARVAKESLRDKKVRSILKKDLTAKDVFAALDGNDAVAKKTLREAVEFWGMAVANLVSLFNPEKIIFGGGVFGPATKFLPDIFAEARKWAQPISIQQVKLVRSSLGGDAGLYGAAFMAKAGKIRV